MDPELLASSIKTPKYSLDGTLVHAKCVKVYDGDTAQFVFRTDPGKPLYRYSCRMRGYNSAEIKGGSAEEKAKAVLSRDALAGLILDRVVKISLGDFDKYGRPLVTVNVDGVNVNEWMVEGGHGKPYTGAGEKVW